MTRVKVWEHDPFLTGVKVDPYPRTMGDEPNPDRKIPDVLDISGAADLLGVSKQRVHELVTDGTLPARRVPRGNGWIIRRAVLEQRLKEHPR